MSERGLLTEDAPACPFVAFEDDRDGRSTAPDHRHRCFAEPRPAPRALAHQEAYCLSSAFPVCPTFQDWARREAAAARPVPANQSAPRDEPPPSRPVPPPARPPYDQQAGTFPPPRRSTQRDWAAPPPWVGGEPDGRPAAGAAAAGAAAGAAAAGAAAWASESSGLAGSAADRLAGPDPDEPRPASPSDPDRHDDGLDDAWPAGTGDADAYPASTYPGGAGAYVAGSASARPSSASRAVPPPRRSEPARRSAADQVSKPVEQDPSELFGPAWERPRRYEAYPTLRTRMGLPALGGIPRVAVWGLLLLLAALLLFLFGPSLLGLGGDDGGGSGATPKPTATEQVTAEPEPTPVPVPTQQVYVVIKGDTMSKIAKKTGVSVEDLLAANPQIKNPNKIAIGDEITVPVPVEEDASAGEEGTVEGESQAP